MNAPVVVNPASILVVDDTPANLQVLAGMLKERGYKVRPVPSGKLALMAARREAPDLILLDINMPEMNGYEVCEELKRDTTLKDIPVIFISALTEPLDKVKAFATGGVDYLTKPFQMEELHARVETHLKLRRQHVDLQEYSHQLEAARERIRQELNMARWVQRSFLPVNLPQVPGYEFFAHYEPVDEIGGDYYDVITLPGPRYAVLLGDVSGKGVSAALLMAKLSADARYCILRDVDDVGAAFTRLNVLMNQSAISSRFVTLIAAVLDPASNRVTLVNAGHLPPIIYRCASGTFETASEGEQAGFPLGVVEKAAYCSSQVTLSPGDTIVAFTDGVTEAMDVQGRQLETSGVQMAMQGGGSPKAICERVVDAIRKFTADRPQNDDIAIVVFGRTL